MNKILPIMVALLLVLVLCLSFLVGYEAGQRDTLGNGEPISIDTPAIDQNISPNREYNDKDI